jgi:hypothetical protein
MRKMKVIFCSWKALQKLRLVNLHEKGVKCELYKNSYKSVFQFIIWTFVTIVQTHLIRYAKCLSVILRYLDLFDQMTSLRCLFWYHEFWILQILFIMLMISFSCSFWEDDDDAW